MATSWKTTVQYHNQDTNTHKLKIQNCSITTTRVPPVTFYSHTHPVRQLTFNADITKPGRNSAHQE